MRAPQTWLERLGWLRHGWLDVDEGRAGVGKPRFKGPKLTCSVRTGTSSWARSITECACRSNATAPEGVVIEFSTSAAPIDADEWIDPEVVAHCGIDASDLARYRRPPGFASKGGTVPQPDPYAKANFVFPDEWKERGERLLHMTDEETAAALSVPTPPVPKKRVVNG